MRCLYCIETRGKMELLILTYVTSDITYEFGIIVLFNCFVGHVYRCGKVRPSSYVVKCAVSTQTLRFRFIPTQ